MRKFNYTLIVLAVCFIFLTQAHAATTWTVCSSGCDFATIQEAIDTVNPGDTISVLEPVHTEPDIMVSKDLTIKGQSKNSTIVQSANTPNTNSGRVFNVSINVTASIRDMTIRNGRLDPDSGGVGGGIYNKGTLTLINCIIAYNVAFGGGGISNEGQIILRNSEVTGNYGDREGGGIKNKGQMTLTDCIINGNGTDIENGSGGGIYTANTMILTDCTIDDNSTENGGGIYNLGEMIMTNFTVSGNSANEFSGGIRNFGRMTLTNGVITRNTAGGLNQNDNSEGGIGNHGEMRLMDCIINENRDGIFNSGQMALADCSITGNVGRFGGGNC